MGKEQTEQKNKYSREILVIGILLALAVAYGFFLRIFALSHDSIWIDEAFSLNAALSIMEKGLPLLDSGSWYARAPLHSYLVAASSFLFGLGPFAGRLISVLLGAVTVVVMYFLGKAAFSRHIGLLASLMTALSYWEIAWSRQARMYILLQFFFMLALVIFLRLLRRFSIRDLAILGAVTLLAMLSHRFAVLLLPLYAIGLIAFTLISPKGKERARKAWSRIKRQKKAFLWIIVAAAFIAAAVLIATFWPVLVMTLNKTEDVTEFFRSWLMADMPALLAMALLGLAWSLLREKNVFRPFFLLLCYTIPFTVIIYATELAHLRYTFFLLPIVFIFLAYATNSLGNYAKKYALPVKIILIAPVIALTGNFVLVPSGSYALEPLTPQPDFQTAYDRIQENWSDDMAIMSPYPAMDKVMLGQADYWLPISLIGKRSDLEETLSEGDREFYANALIIKSSQQMTQILDERTGYAILDSMSRVRLDSDLLDALVLGSELVWADAKGGMDDVWLYKY